jgi:hypothetical protein
MRSLSLVQDKKMWFIFRAKLEKWNPPLLPFCKRSEQKDFYCYSERKVSFFVKITQNTEGGKNKLSEKTTTLNNA